MEWSDDTLSFCSLKTTGNELTSVRQKTQDEMHLAEKEMKEMADKKVKFRFQHHLLQSWPAPGTRKSPQIGGRGPAVTEAFPKDNVFFLVFAATSPHIVRPWKYEYLFCRRRRGKGPAQVNPGSGCNDHDGVLILDSSWVDGDVGLDPNSLMSICHCMMVEKCGPGQGLILCV